MRHAGEGEMPPPALSHWLEWKERCAVALCSPDAQQYLGAFVAANFTRQTQRYMHRTNLKGQVPSLPTRDCMHWLETAMTLRQTGQGKAYKHWLFARSPGHNKEPSALESGVALLIRDAARDFLRREYSPAFMISLANPDPEEHAHGLELEDLLPAESNPSDESALRELEQLAEWHALQWESSLERPVKAAILARALGISLAHPSVQKMAACRKSYLHEAHQAFYKAKANELKEQYQAEGTEFARLLALQAFEVLASRLASKAPSDPACKPLLTYAEAT